MYEHEIEVVIRLTVALKLCSHSTDEVSLDAVMDDAVQLALESVNVEDPCIVAKEEVSSVDLRSSNFVPMDEAA